MRHIMGRLRISLGHHVEVLVVTLFVAFMLIPGLACPELRAAEPNCSFVVANAAAWSTDLFVTNASATDLAVRLEECRVAPCLEYRLVKDGGSLRFPNFGGFGFRTAENPLPPLALGFTFLRYDDGATKASYEVPCLWPLAPGFPSTVGPIVSDGDLVTTVTVLGEGRVDLEVLDGELVVIGSEYFDASGVTQYQLRTRVTVGSLRISTRATVGCPGCNFGSVRGFVSVSDRRGGNARVLAF
jgi:hypothetical protein